MLKDIDDSREQIKKVTDQTEKLNSELNEKIEAETKAVGSSAAKVVWLSKILLAFISERGFHWEDPEGAEQDREEGESPKGEG